MKNTMALIMIFIGNCFANEDRLPGIETTFQLATRPIFRNIDSVDYAKSYAKMDTLLRGKKYSDSVAEVKSAIENRRISDSILWYTKELSFKRKKYEDSVQHSHQYDEAQFKVNPNTGKSYEEEIEEDVYEIDSNTGEPVLDNNGDFSEKEKYIKKFDYTTMLGLAKYRLFGKSGNVVIYVHNYEQDPSYLQADVNGDILTMFRVNIYCSEGTYKTYKTESYVSGVEQPFEGFENIQTMAISSGSYEYNRCLEFNNRKHK